MSKRPQSGSNISKSQSQMMLPNQSQMQGMSTDKSIKHSQSSMRFTNPLLQTKYEERRGIMGTHYQRLMQKNKQFFDHVSGDDIEGMCICGKCKTGKCKLEQDYRKGGESIYMQDFKEKDNRINKARLDKEYYTRQFYNDQPVELNTINRSDYIQHKVEPFKMGKGQKGEEKFLPFSGLSSYKNSFIKYPHNPLVSLKPPNHPTCIKDLAMSGKTSYNQNFLGKQVARDPEYEKLFESNKRGFFKSPMNPDFPFLDETTNGFTYQPFKTRKNKYQTPQHNYNPLPGYEGQFTSTTQHDYYGKKANKCPAREILSTKYNEELKKLKQ